MRSWLQAQQGRWEINSSPGSSRGIVNTGAFAGPFLIDLAGVLTRRRPGLVRRSSSMGELLPTHRAAILVIAILVIAPRSSSSGGGFYTSNRPR